MFELDVTDSDTCDKFALSLPEELKKVDILVNNAGLALSKSLTWENDWEDVNIMINTNVKSIVKMIKIFVPEMIKRNSGHIVNVGSIAGKESYAGGSIYCGTKHMVEAINNSLRMELVATPIRVSLISPGIVETEFSLVRFGDKQKADAVYQGLTPLSPDDIADNIVYVSSRPSHVQIADIITFATNQSTCTTIHRSQ